MVPTNRKLREIYDEIRGRIKKQNHLTGWVGWQEKCKKVAARIGMSASELTTHTTLGKEASERFLYKSADRKKRNSLLNRRYDVLHINILMTNELKEFLEFMSAAGAPLNEFDAVESQIIEFVKAVFGCCPSNETKEARRNRVEMLDGLLDLLVVDDPEAERYFPPVD